MISHWGTFRSKNGTGRETKTPNPVVVPATLVRATRVIVKENTHIEISLGGVINTQHQVLVTGNNNLLQGWDVCQHIYHGTQDLIEVLRRIHPSDIAYLIHTKSEVHNNINLAPEKKDRPQV